MCIIKIILKVTVYVGIMRGSNSSDSFERRIPLPMYKITGRPALKAVSHELGFGHE